MDKASIEICEAFAKAGYPLDVEALLIVEVEGSDAEMDATLADITAIARANGATTVRESRSAIETAAIWKGRKSAFGATGRVADYLCMDGTVPTGKLSYVLAEISKIVQRHGLRQRIRSSSTTRTIRRSSRRRKQREMTFSGSALKLVGA
jgi:glycolate oxidase